MSKTLQRHFRCSGDELEEFRQIFFVEGAQRAPEPLHLKGIRSVFVIFGVRFQIFDVDVRKTRDQQFQFLFVENGNETLRNDAVETF